MIVVLAGPRFTFRHRPKRQLAKTAIMAAGIPSVGRSADAGAGLPQITSKIVVCGGGYCRRGRL